MTDCFLSSPLITFLLSIQHCHTLNSSVIGLLDKPLPPINVNGSLCFLHSHTRHCLSARTVIFFIKLRNVWCHIVQLVFCPTNSRLWSFFSTLLSVTRCSTNSHLRLSNAVSLLRAARGWWVLGLFLCMVGQKMLPTRLMKLTPVYYSANTVASPVISFLGNCRLFGDILSSFSAAFSKLRHFEFMPFKKTSKACSS